jgi:acyl-CoA reductase-like NAD-dependent aldehyde dehydrogenase
MLRGVARRFATLAVENPYSFETVAEVPYVTPAEAASQLNMAASFQEYWKERPLTERIDVLRKAMAWMDENKDTVTREASL